jgi:hypothetical protein
MARAQGAQQLARKLARMVEEAPALPLLVRADGRIEGASRLAGWLGRDAMPDYLTELEDVLDAQTLGALTRPCATPRRPGRRWPWRWFRVGVLARLSCVAGWPIRSGPCRCGAALGLRCDRQRKPRARWRPNPRRPMPIFRGWPG